MSWFADLQAQAESLGASIQAQAETLSATVAEKVREAQENLDSEAAALAEEDAQAHKGGARLMPWERLDENDAVDAIPGLMEKVLGLSLASTTFQVDVPDSFASAFDLTAEIGVIERLLDIDPNLGAMQARYSGRMEEEKFWATYFYQCEKLKLDCLVDEEYEKVARPRPDNGDATTDPTTEASDELDMDDEFDVDDDELEAAIEAELAEEMERNNGVGSAGVAGDGEDELEDVVEISSGEIINAEDELDDDELEAQIAAELGD
uniref:BSD domain-containing protein n=1 Tax=Phaeomonas parva TaxID=124430 RepID=A0A7S1U6G6_9STRA|mmetsp:Transcript_30540/g.97452  ORF Transcript_30540/g.97452 Transcript_30540/m.97452 type:complete len:264 (+) Transcript_30540:237-1028(+)